MQRDPAHVKDVRDSEFDDKDRMGLIRDVCTGALDRVVSTCTLPTHISAVLQLLFANNLMI